MGPRARLRVTDEREAEDGVLLGAGMDAESSDPDQERAYEEFRAQSEVEKTGMMTRVYMIPQNERGEPNISTKMEFLFSAPIDQYTLDEIFRRVQLDFMEPDDKRWWVRVMVRKEGRNGVLMNNLHPVRALPKTARVSATGTPQREGVGEVLAAVREMLADSQRRNDESIARALQLRPQPEGFSARDFIQFMTSSQEKTMGQFTAMVQALAGARGNGSTEPTGIMGMVSALRAIKGLSDDLGGGGGGDGEGGDSTLGVIKALGPPVTAFIELMGKNKPVASPQLPPVPAPATTPVAGEPVGRVAASETPAQNEAAMLAILKGNLKQIADAAAVGANPAEVAKQVLESLPEAFDDPIYDLLSAPDWFPRLIAIQPEVSAHQEWFGKLRGEILASFDAET